MTDPSRRRALAAAELAVCLPMLTLIVFGSLQACNLIYLKHGAVTAAYEGTLELAKRNASSASVIARAEQVLAARGVRGATIQIHPAGTDVYATPPGTPFSIEVVAPVSQNMPLSGFFPLPRNVTGRISSTR